MNHAARINKVNFQILGIGNLFAVKAGGGKACQPINRPTLQQLGQGALQGHFKAGMRPKTSKTALVFGMQQGDVDDRILPPQRGIFDQNAITRRPQPCNPCGNVGIAVNHGLWHIRQTNAVTDNAEFNIALKNFGKGLGTGFHQGIARRHAVADIQVANHINGEQHGLLVTQPLVRDGANAPFGITGI